jgi:GNAT superfamily N-acetyltransferase
MAGVISLRSRNHISLLFVLGEYHRRGIGSALVETMKEYVLAEGKENFLTVDSSPYAVGFYHKNGFSDTEPVQRKDGIIYTPMQCSLDAEKAEKKRG